MPQESGRRRIASTPKNIDSSNPAKMIQGIVGYNNMTNTKLLIRI